MRLHAIHGDLADVAPAVADAAVFWARSNFGRRYSLWQNFLERYSNRLIPARALSRNPRAGLVRELRVDMVQPWLAQADQLWEIRPPDQRLRYLFVFANPTNEQGYEHDKWLAAYLKRCLLTLADFQVRNLALIHIPLKPGPGDTNVTRSEEAAATMVRTIRDWDQQNPQQLDDVFLVDLEDGFSVFKGLPTRSKRFAEGKLRIHDPDMGM